MTPHTLTQENKMKNTEFLYPHDKQCFRIVAPRIKTEQRFLVKLVQNNIFEAVSLAMIMLFTSKLIFNRSSRRQHNWLLWCILEFLSILAMFFGQKRPKCSNKISVTIWNIQLVSIVIFSTAALSAVCYQTLVSIRFVNQIDSLSDLIQSNLTIFVENSMKKEFEAWKNYLE